MKKFYSTSSSIVPAMLILLLFAPLRSAAQIMISHDGNNGKDMIASIRNTDGNDVEVYDFSYNGDRTLNSLKMTAKYDEESSSMEFGYTWSVGKLTVHCKYNWIDAGTCYFDLNPSYCVIADNSFNCAYTFNYDSNGYMVSMTEEGIPGTLTWEDGNLTEFQCGNYRRILSYTDIDNNTNMDLGFCGVAIEGFLCMPIGKWSKKYPKYIAEYLDGQLSYEGNLEYVADEKGRIIKITLAAVEIENDTRRPYTGTMEISYDKSFETSIGDGILLHDAAPEYRDISGRLLPAPQRGINIVKGKDGVTRKMIIRK